MPMDKTSKLQQLVEDQTSDQTKTKITNNDQNTIMMDTTILNTMMMVNTTTTMITTITENKYPL